MNNHRNHGSQISKGNAKRRGRNRKYAAHAISGKAQPRNNTGNARTKGNNMGKS